MRSVFQRFRGSKLLAGRVMSVLLLVAIAITGSVSPAQAEATVIFDRHTTTLNNLNVAVYCGAGGQGEIVLISGTVNVLFYEVHNQAGGSLYRSKINGQNVTGIGQTTGDRYQVTMIGMGTSTLHAGQNYMSVTVMNLIGKGSGSKAVLSMVFHITENANGEMTAYVDHLKSECR